VATAVGGVPEIVSDNESALLVPPHDPAAMADAIALALMDEELSKNVSVNASGLARKRFSSESYVRSLIEVYRELVSRRAGSNR